MPNGHEKDNGLEFERAEYAKSGASTMTCSSCARELTDAYYEVNGSAICERCRMDLQLAQGQGGGFSRFAMASGFGLGAGAVRGFIWYAARTLTGYEAGLIAIIVGLLVGGAVRKGSKRRGGWLYQTLAIFLTYTSIVSTYVPDIVGELKKLEGSEVPQVSTSTPTGQPQPRSAPGHATSAEDTGANSASSPDDANPPSLGHALFSLVVLALFILAFAFAVPFLAGFQNIIGILIIGFALYEAWKINPYKAGIARKLCHQIEKN